MATVLTGTLATVVAGSVGATSPFPLVAQTARPPTLDHAAEGLPLSAARSVRFSTDEGTWMSLDVSPDGRAIVFDLLGDLYLVPIAGGRAARLTQGLAFDTQPRFSPDGTRIAFVSDRSGSDNVWVYDLRTRALRQITSASDEQYVSPTWEPDGLRLVVSSAPDISARLDLDVRVDQYVLHEIDVMTGQERVLAPVGPGADSYGYLGATFGPDPHALFVAASRRRGVSFDYFLPLWQIARYDLRDGTVALLTDAYGSAMRPTVSPDGHLLAYGTRDGHGAGIRVRDLDSGTERWLIRDLDRDAQESWPTRDLMPGLAFTPDSRALVLTKGGKIWLCHIASGALTPVPFVADVDVALGPATQFEYPIADSAFTVRQIRDPRPSPDGTRLAFSALDRLWVAELPPGGGSARAARRLTTDTVGEFMPTWSPDGRYIAYVTWDGDVGSLRRVRSDGRTPPDLLTAVPAAYERIAYTPDGTKLLAFRAPATLQRRRAWASGDLVWLPAAGGGAHLVATTTAHGFPHFVTGASDPVYMYEDSALVAVRLDGSDRHVVLPLARLADKSRVVDAVLSPDGRNVLALVDGGWLYAGQVPPPGTHEPLALSRAAPSGGEFPGWNSDGSQLFYSLGHSYFTVGVQGGGDTTLRIEVSIPAATDRPRGTLLLRGAQLLTMTGAGVIPHGDVLVRDNRIVAVGPAGSVPIAVPQGADTLDVTGKTVLPGYVDIHWHSEIHRYGGPLHPSQSWEYLTTLAYGTTTIRDPQTTTTDVLTYADRVRTGDMLGPRVFTTGPGIDLRYRISTLQDARAVARRYGEFYGTETLKIYGPGPRGVRQWMAVAAREQRLTPTNEGFGDFKRDLTYVLDGDAGTEHALPALPLHRDVIELLARSGVTYTPTLVVAYGGPAGVDYWLTHSDLLGDAKLRHFIPPWILDEKARRRREWFRDDEYVFQDIATDVARVVRAGGHVGLGSHGELQGLGAHWELWMLASGGLPPYDALRLATAVSATAIGHGKDVGSIEVGKLADLQILDRDPLADIHNTVSIRYVMRNGRLYDAHSLAEVWPRHGSPPFAGWSGD